MEKYYFDAVTKTLTITAKFAEQMGDPDSDEYALVLRFQHDFPGLRIAKRTHKSPASYTTKSGEKYRCNQFKNLTYSRMEKFITALPQCENYLREYTFVKDFASAVQHNSYALVRTWFVAQFPEFRKNPMFYLYNSPEVIHGSQFLEEATEKKIA